MNDNENKAVGLMDEQLKWISGGSGLSNEPCPTASSDRYYYTCSLPQKDHLTCCDVCHTLSANKKRRENGGGGVIL